MAWVIKEVRFSDILPLKRAAAADRVTLNDLKNTRWFAVYRDDGLIVGSAGLTVSKSRARIRGVWVANACRGQGIGVAITSRLLAECRGQVTSVDAFAYNPAHYQARGFRVVGKTTSAGATRVALVLAVRARAIAVRKSNPAAEAVPHPQSGCG